MLKPQLSTPSGQFTLSDSELLKQAEYDNSTSIMQLSDEPTFFKHPMDNLISPILQKHEVVLTTQKASKPIAKVVSVLLGTKSLYQIQYSKHFTPQLRNYFKSLLNHRTPSAIQPSIECQAFEFASSKLTNEQFELLLLIDIPSMNCKDQLELIAQCVNYFFDLIQNYLKQPHIRKKIRDRNSNCNKTNKSCIELTRGLLQRHSRVVVVRADLSIKRDPKTLLRNAYRIEDIQSEHDLTFIKQSVAKLNNNSRNNPTLKEVIGYIFRFEYSVRTGFHVHAYFFFDGNKHREDISLAQGIAKLWNEKVTGGQGSTYICNMNKDNYRYCALGMIHYSDLEKQSYLFRTFDYICKADQMFIFSNMKNARRFQLSAIPKKPKSSSGRPRQYQQIDLDFSETEKFE